jgi:LPS sulfotransferase NodH
MSKTKKRHIPFVVIFQGRCGSTYLVEALHKHSRIHCEKEYFSTIRKQKGSADGQLRWLAELYDSPPVGCSAVGFKTKLADVMDRDGFVRMLGERQVHIIHLQRRNTVKLTVSLLNAMRLNELTGDWNLYRASDRPTKLRVDLDDFDHWLKNSERLSEDEAAFVSRLRLPTLNAYYEDVLSDEAESLQEIMGFLGVDFEPVRGDAMKVTSNDLRDAVENFDELLGRYRGTSYEPMFVE